MNEVLSHAIGLACETFDLPSEAPSISAQDCARADRWLRLRQCPSCLDEAGVLNLLLDDRVILRPASPKAWMLGRPKKRRFRLSGKCA